MSISEINVDQLAALLDAEPSLRLIDVREADEYGAGHVPGARLVALGTVPDHLDAFRGEGPAYVICRSGARSMRACEFLAEHGIEAVNVAGGTMTWVTSGRDVVGGDQPS
jgi:rhodanese-related sulfurtransferase